MCVYTTYVQSDLREMNGTLARGERVVKGMASFTVRMSNALGSEEAYVQRHTHNPEYGHITHPGSAVAPSSSSSSSSAARRRNERRARKEKEQALFYSDVQTLQPGADGLTMVSSSRVGEEWQSAEVQASIDAEDEQLAELSGLVGQVYM
jgi:hypothetical protein